MTKMPEHIKEKICMFFALHSVPRIFAEEQKAKKEREKQGRVEKDE